MGIGVLGPLDVRIGDDPVTVPGVKERRLLALLVSRAGDAVPIDRIVDALWGTDPPSSAAKSLQVHVTRLRSALAGLGVDGRPVVERRGSGYAIVVTREQIDALVFADLLDRARSAGRSGAPDVAGRLLREALRLWRGTAYADFRDTDFGAAEAARWEELRLLAVEERIEADLALGRHAELTGELEALVSEHPLRERLWTQLMVALYRSGRQSDALAAFRRARALLVEQLGVEPSPALLSLERRVLAHDPALAPPDVATAGPPPLPSPLARPAPVFLGRDHELATLCARWEAAECGQGGLVLVVGPPGSGRTSLLAELARYAHSRGGEVRLVGDPAPPRGRNDGSTRPAPRPRLLVADDAEPFEPQPLEEWRRLAIEEPGALLVVALDPATAQGISESILPCLDLIRLRPLEVADARDVVRAYLGEAATPAVVDRLAAEGRGLPGRLRALAVDHRERTASDRVSAGAAEAPAARQALSRVRATITTNVLELQQARALRAPARDVFLPLCPFKGLARFEREDAAIFRGREDVVAALVARLVDTPLLAVVGPSGSGKSSLVRAGLLPALAAAVLPGSDRWAQRIIRPGDTPRKSLSAALADVGDGGLVIVVDQFEELFVGDAAADEVAGFVADLLALVAGDRTGAPTRAVLTLRSDRLGNCARHPGLVARLADATVLVPPLTDVELRRAVEGPAEYAGLTVEPALLDAVVADVEGRPGALPLLSTALLDTWERRSGLDLTYAGYLSAGGVSGALARLAERAFAQLTTAEQQAARRILLRLAATAETGPPVARRVPLDEVAPPNDEVARTALDVLVTRRLLTTDDTPGGTTLEVAHEALLAHWPRLARWLEEDEQGRALRRHLTPAALEWAATGRPETELYRGSRLEAALEWAATHRDDLQPVEREFLDAGRRAADRELREQRDRADREARGRRRLRTVLVAVVVLLAVAASAAVVAVRQTGNARTAERSAQARRLGALALTEQDLDRSLLLAAAAMRTDDSPETEGDVLATLLRSPHALGQARAAHRLQDLALSPDGQTIAVPDNGGTLTFMDARTLRPAQPSASVGVWSGHVVFAPDGRRLAVLAGRTPGENDIAIWDMAARRLLRRLPVPAIENGEPGRPAWTADGRSVATGSDTGSLFLDDATTGQHRQVRLPAGGPAHPIDAFAAAGLVVAVAEGTHTAFVVDPSTAEIRRRVPLPVAVDHAGVDPGGTRLAVSDGAGNVHVVDLATGATRQVQGKHTGRVWGLVFSGNGDRLASFGDDATVLVGDARSGQLLLTLEGHTGRVMGGQFSADGGELWTSGLDSSVIAWDLTDRRSLAVTGSPGTAAPFPNAQGPFHVAWSRDRTRAALVWDGGILASLDMRTGTIRPAGRLSDEIGHVALSPDGREAYLTTLDRRSLRGLLRRWMVAARRPEASTDLDGIEDGVDVSPDGREVAVGTYDDDVSRHTPIYFLDPGTLSPVSGPLDVLQSPLVAFSPDGRSLAVGSETGAGVAVVDAATRRVRWIDRSVSQTFALGFSPDGRQLAVGSQQGIAAVFDPETGTRLAGPTEVQPGIVITITFSPDGRTLLIAGADGLARLWQPVPLRPLAPSLFPPDDVGRTGAFSADGAHIMVVDVTGRLSVWDARPQAWLQRACSIANRDFTAEERIRYAITSDTTSPCP